MHGIGKHLKRHRKAQVQNEIFIYIISILVIGLLLYFGIKWIGGLASTKGKIDITQAKIDFEKTFRSYRSSYGKWGEEELSVPPGIERVCFVDKSIEGMYDASGEPMDGWFSGKGLCKPDDADYDPLICDAWKTKNEINTLFDPMGKVDSGLDVGKIKISGQGYACFGAVSGKIKMMLTGTGDSVAVSAPAP